MLVGINGAQGTGKSTLALLLQDLLCAQDYKVAVLSIDDFYLSRSSREQLARSVHPLLASRGVPGTHDVELLQKTLQALASASRGQLVELPAFDKATDDIVAPLQRPRVEGPIDLILLEGWFIGAGAQSEELLENPVNALEQKEDPEGHWRHWVNAKLAGQYQQVFQQLDLLILMQAPSFEQVYQWRGLQESKLRQKNSGKATAVMDESALRRFIEHFERLTRHCLQTLPQQADLIYRLNQQHQVVDCQDRRQTQQDH